MEFIRTPKVENVRFLYRFQTASNLCSTGTLYLTATHLIFVDHELKRETWILHSLIASVEKLPISTIGSPLLMRCKHFLCITFVIPKDKEAHDIYQSLMQLSQPSSIKQLYCFNYTASNEFFTIKDGWNKVSLESEYKRMGCPNSLWKLSTLNQNYETYPRKLYLPASADDLVIKGSAKFRSKSRLPVLVYLHKNKASICRCAQPLSGFKTRCIEDEKLLDHIRKTNQKSSLLYVVDTRPKINAIVNKAQGKGYENEIYYENIKFHFFGIENIHVMRGSLQKLIDACELRVPSMNSFLNSVEGSGWLRHVKAILETSVFIAQSVENGISTIIHCSDGWDRTAQTCSIASIILDPYYRTIDGFQTLIRKDWLAFGHKFNDRCGHINRENGEMAPVFTQFLDIMLQHPCAFEFNERFLIMINDFVYNVQFGTFLCNCEKEREELRLSQRTYSVWAYLDEHRIEYLNPLYRNDDSMLQISVAPQMIRFWRGLYNRFETGVHPRDSVEDVLRAKFHHVDALRRHVSFLENLLEEHRLKMKNQEGKIRPLGSIDLDEIERPLKVVEECMQRLKMKHEENMKGQSVDGYDDENFVIEDCQKDSRSESRNSHDSENSNDSRIESPHPRPNSLNLALNKFDSDCFNQNDHQVSKEKHRNHKNITNHGDESIDSDQTIEQIVEDFNLISLNWQSFQNLKNCFCSTPLEPYSTRLHCFACGRIFCIRCIDKRCSVPCHQPLDSSKPICRNCFVYLTRSNSIDIP
ncbi:myotubularin-related protein 6-like protein [Sarcoptes scabiei]|uniref:phosphatidylinositol-3,5-bisphosphate 3-phosphatase n=1 Tax=Sarcoptes scabiei TaxID=52283 RepID=A0A132AGC3_SARSC|nr:myotubularin-related protein 6-like protein [Sarcoptes scabiei]